MAPRLHVQLVLDLSREIFTLEAQLSTKRAELQRLLDGSAPRVSQVTRAVHPEIPAEAQASIREEHSRALEAMGGRSVSRRLRDILESNADLSYKAEELVRAAQAAGDVKLHLESVRTLLARMEKAGEIERVEAGLYRARRPNGELEEGGATLRE
jgi:hypothetical protein